MSPEAEKIIRLIKRHPLPLNTEKAAQSRFAEILSQNGIAFEREVKLPPKNKEQLEQELLFGKDIVDFMCGDIAIEMKIKGSRVQIFRQLERYADRDCVKEIILMSARSIHLPELISGKPAYFASMSAAFL